MRKADFAELVLSLVTSQERSVSIVGDLLEGDDAGNPCHFWFFIVRTAFCLLWRQMVAAPFDMAGTVLLGISVEFGLLLLWGASIVLVMLGPVADASRAIFHADLPEWSTRWLPYLLSNVVVWFTLGRWISRRYHGRQGAATLSLAIFHAVITLCAGLICWAVAHAGGEAHVDVTIFVPVIVWDGNIVRTLVSSACYLTLYPLLLLAGTVSVRTNQ